MTPPYPPAPRQIRPTRGLAVATMAALGAALVVWRISRFQEGYVQEDRVQEAGAISHP